MKHTIISRKEAVQLGLKRYYTGVPCGHGHDSERFVSGSSCMVCTLARSRKSGAGRPERKGGGLTFMADRPCKRGHFERYTRGGGCVECQRILHAERYAREIKAEREAAGFMVPARRAALALGLRHYSTGEACRRGHVSQRYVSSGSCVECARLRNVRRWQEHRSAALACEPVAAR